MRAEADVESPPAAAENPPEEERKAPGYRFPAVEEATAQFAVRLPPFPDAPEGFSGSLDKLLAHLRERVFELRHVPLAPLVDRYLGFRGRLAPREAQPAAGPARGPTEAARGARHLRDGSRETRARVADHDCLSILLGLAGTEGRFLTLSY